MAEKSEILKLGELIVANAVQVEKNSLEVPDAVDVGFFNIVLNSAGDITALKLKNAIIRAEEGVHLNVTVEDLLNPGGVSYTYLGGWLGDQGLALAFIGLGAALELWDVLLPTSVGVTDGPLVEQMMGMGFVHLLVGPDSILRK